MEIGSARILSVSLGNRIQACLHGSAIGIYNPAREYSFSHKPDDHAGDFRPFLQGDLFSYKFARFFKFELAGIVSGD